MPVRVIDVNSEGTDYDLAQGVRYAAGLANDSGTLPPRAAKIINVSVTDPERADVSTVLQSAFHRATGAGAIVVAAAGNEAPARVGVRAPASSGCALAVGATRADRELASYSNYGPKLDLVAPGGDGGRPARSARRGTGRVVVHAPAAGHLVRRAIPVRRAGTAGEQRSGPHPGGRPRAAGRLGGRPGAGGMGRAQRRRAARRVRVARSVPAARRGHGAAAAVPAPGTAHGGGEITLEDFTSTDLDAMDFGFTM